MLGTHRVMYAVGEVARYGDSVRLCYFRGPAGIIIGLSESS